MRAPVDVMAIGGVPRHYAWGSRTAIPQLLGVAATGEPLAELWLGAHEDDPSPVPEHGIDLDDLVAADPAAVLGAQVRQRFGDRLPFLVKVLAAERALSIQVHPDLAQARAGYAAEEAAGVPRGDSRRTYRDANHKPELICALTPFTALCGFRAPEQAVAVIDALPAAARAALAGVQADLSAPVPEQALREAVARLLGLGPDAGAQLVEAVVAGAGAVVGPDPGDDGVPLAGLSGAAAAARVVQLCARDFPGDVGCVLALLLNPVTLAPGEAIYLGAGTVHCYLRGMGVEVMANSDNVLRCGLTGKHVDAAELMKITRFAPMAEPRVASVPAGALRTFPTPAPDFRLSLADPQGSAVEVDEIGPHLVLCTAGQVRVRAGDGEVGLRPGHAAFAPAAAGRLAVRGAGTAFIAGVEQI